MASQVSPRGITDSSSIDTNIGEEVKEHQQSQHDTSIINQGLHDTGTTIDPRTQVIKDRSGFAQATNEWRDYVSNYLTNNTKRLIDNSLPTFAIENGKMKIRGTKEALSSVMASDAKKALSSALTGVDLGTDAAKEVVDMMNESLRNSATEYIATQVYGFKDSADYNNYLLAVQESQKSNPTSGTYYFTTYDKNGNLVKKTFQEWIDYWRSAYSTDERADLFLESANSPYGYNRIPYVLMSGGGVAGNAKYGFDLGEYLGLGVYNFGAQVSKLPHGLTQNTQMALSNLRLASDLLSHMGISGQTDSNALVTHVPEVTEEVFNSILEKYRGHGPVRGGLDALNDQEKAILALGAAPTNILDGPATGEQVAHALETVSYDNYKARLGAAKEIAARDEKMSEVENRIARNMSVYGGSTNYFISNMLGVMARQAIEAYTIKALTGGKVDLNQIGEKLGAKTAEAFGVDLMGRGTFLGTAAGKSLATFVGGIPEDMIQDFIDAGLTNDPTLSNDILTLENVGTNLVYRLAFNAIIKGGKNIIGNVRAFKQLEKAAKDAGYDIDADDIKRGISEAYTAFQNGRQVGVDDYGRVIFEDSEGNLKTLDNVTAWSIQPLANIDVENALDQRAKDAANEIINEWKEKNKVSVSDLSTVRDYMVNGDYVVDNINKADFEMPDNVLNALYNAAIIRDSTSILNPLKGKVGEALGRIGFDDTIKPFENDTRSIGRFVEVMNDAFGSKYTVSDFEGGTLEEILRKIVDAFDRRPGWNMPDSVKDFIVSDMRKGIVDILSDFDDSVRGFDDPEGVKLSIFTASNPSGRTMGDLIDSLLTAKAYTPTSKIGSPEPFSLAGTNPKRYLLDSVNNVLASIANAYHDAAKTISMDETIDFLNAVIADTTALIDSVGEDDAIHRTLYKDYLAKTEATLVDLNYQKNYNQLLTPLPEHTLNDIHASNELGVTFNEQKIALMDEALNTSAADFVFTRLQDDSTIVTGLQTKGDFDEMFSKIMQGEYPTELEEVSKADIDTFRTAATPYYEYIANEDLAILGSGTDAANELERNVKELNKLEADFLDKTGLRKKVSKEGFTQNELLEIWTEAQYRSMDVPKMIELMKDFGLEEDGGAKLDIESKIYDNATKYIFDQDRRPAQYWYEITGQYKNHTYTEWLNDLQRQNHPGIYIEDDGARKVSGRSILEVQMLTDKKLWAASLIRLKALQSEYAISQSYAISGDIKSGTGEVDIDWAKLVQISFDPSLDEGTKQQNITKLITDLSADILDMKDEYLEVTGQEKTGSVITPDFVRWLANKYAMNKTLYEFKENLAARSLPMAEYLNTPFSIARSEKIWGPGRLVVRDGEMVAPSMDLSKETVLSFSLGASGVALGSNDPGEVIIKARPIDILGDMASRFSGEKEVFARKSLVYPAGSKMHTIFMDGTISVNAERVLGDKNARMFQVDESLVVNAYDRRRIRDIVREVISAKKHGWRDDDTGQPFWDKDKLDGTVVGEFIKNPTEPAGAFSQSLYGLDMAKIMTSKNPFVRNAFNKLVEDIDKGSVSEDSINTDTVIATLLNKPFIINDAGRVTYVAGVAPQLDAEIRTNGGLHLNDPQAKRTADAQAILEDWKKVVNNTDAKEKATYFNDNAGIMVDGNLVSFSSLVDDATAAAKMKNALTAAVDGSTKITMQNRLESTPKDAPDPSRWNDPQEYTFKSFADALANRPSYKNAQDYVTWMPAAVDAGVREFNAWRSQVFEVNHPDIDTAQLVETWDFVNFLVHGTKDYDGVNLDDIVGKTFVSSGGEEVTVTQEALDMYGEFDSFIRQQGARMASLEAQGFVEDYNQLGYLPHTDYNPMDQTTEALIQGALWRKNELKNSTNEDGTFTTAKLDNSWDNRYRTWLANMAYDSLGDVAIFGEKIRELIADGDLDAEKASDALTNKAGEKLEPQETVAKAITGDKDLNTQAAKTKSSKDFSKAHTDMSNKTDFKAIEKQTAVDAEKMGYSKALHDNYGDLYGNSRASIVHQNNVFVSKITGLYDFMRSTSTTDGSLLNHGGEMLINPNGMAKEIIRRYRGGEKLKDVVVDMLQRKSGRSAKGAEYIYNKWLPDIQKRISSDGQINSAELSAVLTKHLRYEAWTSIKKWLARADYDKFNPATRKTLDNLLYRHNMIAQVSNNPGVMGNINKAMNAITGMRHRALFYINPKNALLQLSECIRLFSDFKLGDATKALRRLYSDADFRNTVAEWREIIFPDRQPLQNVEPMADAWGKTASFARLGADGTLDIKNTVKGGIQEADAVMMAPINAAEDMKNTTIIAGILQEMETKKANGTLKEPEYDYMMRRFQRIALANDEFGRLGYSDNPFARTLLYLQNFSIRQLKMFGDNVVDTWGAGGAAKAAGYIMKVFGWRMGLFLIMAKLGYSAGQVLGYDPFDLLGEEYTGLDEEDETELDRQISSGWLSPLFAGGVTSLIQDYYFAARQAYERSNELTPAEEASAITNDEESWGLKMPETDWGALLSAWVPGGGAARRTIQMAELMDKGTAVSQSGTRMYEAPTNPIDVAAGFLFGRSNTPNAREYYQTPDPLNGLVEGGIPGFAQQMGRAFSNEFRQFDPIDKQNFTDWFDGSAADEQQWQSGYYYFRNRAKEIYDNYNGQYSGFSTAVDTNELKSGYRAEMEKLGEELNRFSQAYVAKHGQLGGAKMQQLLNILNDAQTNLLMDDAEATQAGLEGLNRAQERYSQAGLPAVPRVSGPSTGSPDAEYRMRFSPQYYNAVQGVYGGSSEAAKILDDLYQNKWKELRKQYSNRAYASGVTFQQRERIQNEYINLIRQDLDGIVAAYGSSILASDAVDDVLTDVFAGMVPYSEYNVNKKGRRVSLPSNVEVDVSDWLQQKYANARKTPSTSYGAGSASTLEQIRALLNSGKTSQAKATARLLLQRVQDQRASLTRNELEWLQGVLND